MTPQSYPIVAVIRRRGLQQAPRGLIARFDAAVASIATLALGVCVNAQSPAAVSFCTLARGADSKIQTRHELVARTVGSWHLLWHEHGGADDPPPPVDGEAFPDS